MDHVRKKRAAIRSAITRITNYCDSPDANEAGVRARSEKIDYYFEQFEQLQSEIESENLNSDQASIEEAIRVEIEEKYYHVKALNGKFRETNTLDKTVVENSEQTNQITSALDTLARNQNTLGTIIDRLSNDSHSATPQVNVEQVNIPNAIQLPRIHLPEFSGNYTEWIRFRDIFTALIHDRVNISGIEKFEYLLSHVTGEALSLIKHLCPSNDNYIIAWNLIKNRFDNSEVIKKNYIKLLFDQPHMKGPFTSELKRFTNTTCECINALKAMHEQTDAWDSVLIFHLERKLDPESQTLWCRSASEQSFEKFKQFLEMRLREFENTQAPKNIPQNYAIKHRIQSQVNAATIKSCPVCQQAHFVFNCEKFRALDVNNRIKIVKENRMCFNCLQYDHTASDCSRSGCKVCKGKHNSLLHKGEIWSYNNRNRMSNKMTVNTVHTISKSLTILPTAVVLILGANDSYYPCRILLDTGAQTSLISEACVQRLSLRRKFDKTLLCGIGGENKNYTKGKVDLTLKSRINDTMIKTTALCLTKLTQLQPPYEVRSQDLEFFNDLCLADPHFNVPNHIDIILGADVFSQCSFNRQKRHPSGSPSALDTVFGWVIIGNVRTEKQSSFTIAHTMVDLSEQLQQFWNIEELQGNKIYLTEEEQLAENMYQQTVERREDGRYMVRLPFKEGKPTFGNTEGQAIKRLHNMENRFINNKALHKEYKNFMDEYLKLDHMEAIERNCSAECYLPHHAVTKLDSTTTKLRVVFDGSAKSSAGNSLNEQLLIGPTIQQDIFVILIQFRKYEIGMSSDIEKMYRQILIHPDDRKFQCIVWRADNEQKITTYKLKTITYGTSAAPFLAVRTLKQIAIDNKLTYPHISSLIMDCFYVDDFMASMPSVETAVQVRQQLCEVLCKSGMHLRKWSTNSNEVLKTIDERDRENATETVIEDTRTVKTLGLYWNTTQDVFKYSVFIPSTRHNITKRVALSIISKIYDPLGWVAPVVVTMKLFMQKIWLRGVDWDSVLEPDLQRQWHNIHDNISTISNIQIPRWLQYESNCEVQLHGFADASELAYAAVVYLKVVHNNGLVTTRIVASKTRVAPVKQVTLPRLELCACHLLTKLLTKIKLILKIENIEIHAWTDSTIVLAWLSDHPRKWKNFVANRTSYIINILPAQHWHHIPSNKNPADLATRGVNPSELHNSTLWWNGPVLLKNNEYPRMPTTHKNCAELEIRKNIVLHVDSNQQQDLFCLYSNFWKLVRMTALIYRFVQNCRVVKHKRKFGFLSYEELNFAHNALIKRAQRMNFDDEIKLIVANKQLTSNHKLSSLAPFVDKDGCLRVGGRLENANISYGQKHPLILHKDNALTELIVRYYHLKYLHAGARQLQYLIGLKYWIPSVTYVIKRCVYKCTTCMRHRKLSFQQQMGNLPKHRLEEVLPFQNVGTDFAGPITIRAWKGRGGKQYKCWIALFICLVTKAMHLELVTELSTEAFIASLRRFVARRGKPMHIYSDNGTNFVGCNKRLKELMQFMLSAETQETVNRKTIEWGIQWHFSPPCGPNFGGVWEAGVKSVKHHLNRVLGDTCTTYEEMSTVLCQIESCLNSRPISAKFEGDADPITPAHFLLQKPVEFIVDENVLNVNLNKLSRWQYLQRLIQTFWRKWSISYLSQLQNRPKWKLRSENLKKDDIVLIKDELQPPSKWLLAKVIETHPGADGLVRVVTVQTKKGNYKRPVSKICPLVTDY